MADTNQTIQISKNNLTNNQIAIESLLMLCGISPGGATARRLIRNGAAFVNGIKITDETRVITEEELRSGMEIKVGKKISCKVVLEK